MRYYIIEHPTRGILTVNSEVNEPRFSWSMPRGDERAMRSYSLGEATDTLDTYTGKVRDKCKVLASPVDGEVEWTECPV